MIRLAERGSAHIPELWGRRLRINTKTPSSDVHLKNFTFVFKRIVVAPPPGQAPADSIQPGQPGGGDPPQTNNFASFLAPPGKQVGYF